MSAKDRYVSVDDGKLVMNVENDGWTFMTKGPERTEQSVALESLERYRILRRGYIQSQGKYSAKVSRSKNRLERA